jgi:hypothetical protein
MKKILLSAFIALCGLWLAAAANAKTLGQVAPPGLGGCNSCDGFQSHVGKDEPRYRVPSGKWTITSWSAEGGGSAVGKARLRVYRPTGTKGQFQLVKQSKLEIVPASGHPSFATSIKVQGGDLLGLETRGDVGLAYPTTVAEDEVQGVHCSSVPLTVGTLVGVGTECGLATVTSRLVNVSAVLVPR